MEGWMLVFWLIGYLLHDTWYYIVAVLIFLHYLENLEDTYTVRNILASTAGQRQLQACRKMREMQKKTEEKKC